MISNSQDPSRDSTLDQLVEELCDQMQSGQLVELETLIQQHPEIENRLRVIYPMVQAIANWSSNLVAAGPHRVDHHEFGNREIGDFQIIRQIGRGGMGVVYEAQQLSIQRKVALKVLPLASLVDSRALQRFKNEVTAIATLQHPHIVAVYSIGEDRGIHYFAMQLIHGQSLAAVIGELRTRADQDQRLSGEAIQQAVSKIEKQESAKREMGQTAGVSKVSGSHGFAELDETMAETVARGRSSTRRNFGDATYFRNIARLIQQAAEALQHSHDHGIVHRDVKPGNLLLDADGTLFVTDFGLARIETGAGLTVTGDVMGTLRYMSPEQVLNNRTLIDHRTDIYSLGATLYELLTLQSIWPDGNRAELIRKISYEDPTRPRKVNPAIPTDLETIVLKAINKNPNDRYESAQAFADDLQCFANHRPILAKRVTLVERLNKWTRRHPSAVWATTLLMLVLTIVTTVSAGSIWKANLETRRQTIRAERNLDLALDAIDDFLWRVGESQLANLPGSDRLRKKLLEDARLLCLSFIDDDESDPRVRLRSAKANVSLGTILIELGEDEAALRILNNGITDLEEWIHIYPDDKSTWKARQDLAGSYVNLGGLYMNLADFENAAIQFQTAIDMQHQDLSTHEAEIPGDERGCLLRGMASRNQATALLNLNRNDEAVTASRIAVNSFSDLVQQYPDDPDYRVKLAWALQALGLSLEKLQDRKQALATYQRAISILREWSDKSTEVSWSHSVLGGVLCSCAILTVVVEAHPAAKQLDPAEALLNESLSLFQELHKQFPNLPEYRSSMTTCYLHLAGINREHGNFKQAADLIEQAISIQRSLVVEFPQRADYQSELAKLLSDFDSYLVSAGQQERAGFPLKESIEILEQLVQDYSEVADYRRILVMSYRNFGQALDRNGQLEDAVTIFQKAIPIASQLVQEYSEVASYRSELSFVHSSLGNVFLAAGKPDDALKQFQLSLDQINKLANQFPENQSYQERLTILQGDVAAAYCNMGELGPSEPIYQRCISLWEKLIQHDPGNANYLFNCAISHSNLAKTYENTDRLVQAADHFGRCLSTLHDLLRSFPTTDAKQEIAKTYGGLIRVHGNIGDMDQALATLTEAATEVTSFVDQDPTNEPLIGSLANIAAGARNLGQAVHARQLFQHAADVAEESLGSKHWMTLALSNEVGLTNEQLQDWPAALECYQLVIRTRQQIQAANPKDEQNSLMLGGAYCNLGNVYCHDGQFDEANQDYANAIEILESLDSEQDYVRAYLKNSYQGRANSHQKGGQHDLAIKDYQQAIGLARNDEQAELQLMLAMSFHATEQFEKAIEANRNAAQDENISALAYYNLACAYSRNKQSEEALEALDRAVELGFGSVEELDQDSDLDHLRSDDRFEQILLKLRRRDQRELK